MSNVDPKNWFDQSIDKAIAARDKWWMERLFQKCPHATQFRIAGECILCLREIKKEVGLLVTLSEKENAEKEEKLIYRGSFAKYVEEEEKEENE
jgi:hypothetical protein